MWNFFSNLYVPSNEIKLVFPQYNTVKRGVFCGGEKMGYVKYFSEFYCNKKREAKPSK